ncbi:hypothetical protein [Roseateles violae]|uniref:Uncharacterized protein n=1 Tax=Roseateles violae TaxID=3058042 RepID=A0ABT8DYH8_9BURK|nr:hypothetical protein [Pelomonas sp. PFR6]MDN3922640.1 hypothetical protein [Pelomonas sp. PFR6]
MEPNAMHRALGLLFVAGAALAAHLQASAQDMVENRLQPVEVTGNRDTPRFDVQRACPDYAEEVKASLARSLPYIDGSSEVRVSFQLKGHAVDSVQTEGGYWEQRRPLKRAVRSISCVNDGQENQRYMFMVVFKPDDGSGREQQMAVRSAEPLTLARKD